jgi:hypothetical protein
MAIEWRIAHRLLLVMAYLLVRMGWQLNRRRVKRLWTRAKDHLPRKRHPKSPKDCPHCRRGVRLETAHIHTGVTPWCQGKSPRGAKKRYSTHGHACLNPDCPYYGLTDEPIHALVRHPWRGKDKDIGADG